MIDIFNSILYLIPDAKFAVWNCTIDKYMGEVREGNPIQLGDVLVDWNQSNITTCPTLQELQVISQVDVANAVEARRKLARDNAINNNLTILSNFQNYLLSHPGISLSQYLDSLESL